MESKRLRQILLVVWGMVFCIDLVLCLTAPEPHPLSWILTGFMLGGIFIMLLTNPIMNLQDKFIKDLMKHIKDYSEMFDKLITKERRKKGGKK